MKYGESAFDLIYLVYAIGMGLLILMRGRNRQASILGTATLILGIGDTFHLVPRVLNYFVDADLSMWIGMGKLATSLTMALFYLLMYQAWLRLYRMRPYRPLSYTVLGLTALRILLCLLPQNGWTTNESPLLWGMIRNIPFVLLGTIIIWLYYQKRDVIPCLRHVWLWMTLSFVFYTIVVVWASLVPMLGMMMLPKTVCYMMLIWAFWDYSAEAGTMRLG